MIPKQPPQSEIYSVFELNFFFCREKLPHFDQYSKVQFGNPLVIERFDSIRQRKKLNNRKL